MGFLFTYQPAAAQLRVWHPGYGTALAGPAAADYLDRAGYVAAPSGVAVGSEYLRSGLDTVGFVAGLLRATAGRPAQFGCFGMHEWAMVYRTDTVRHGRVPLRLGAAGTDAVVESMPLRCSHFDASASSPPRRRATAARRPVTARPTGSSRPAPKGG